VESVNSTKMEKGVAGGDMKTFQATIAKSQLENAIRLPGWQYQRGPSFRAKCTWYPFVEDRCSIVFTARSRTEAARQLDRINVTGRDLVEI